MTDEYPDYSSPRVIRRTVKYFFYYIAGSMAIVGGFYALGLLAARFGGNAVGGSIMGLIFMAILWCVANSWAGAHVQQEDADKEAKWNQLIAEVTAARPDIMKEIEDAGIDLNALHQNKPAASRTG